MVSSSACGGAAVDINRKELRKGPCLMPLAREGLVKRDAAGTKEEDLFAVIETKIPKNDMVAVLHFILSVCTPE
jgi:hypothetical protein